MAHIARTLDSVDCWVYDGPGRAVKAAPKIIELLGIPLPAPGEMIEWPPPVQVAASEPEPPQSEKKDCDTCKWSYSVCPLTPEKNAHCGPCNGFSHWEPRGDVAEMPKHLNPSEAPEPEPGPELIKLAKIGPGRWTAEQIREVIRHQLFPGEGMTSEIGVKFDEGKQRYDLSPVEGTTSETGKTCAESALSDALLLLKERGQDYDKGRERSMSKAVAMFNTATGMSLKPKHGWLLMQLVKIVRQNTAKGFHKDSYLDDISYSALKAEAAAEEIDLEKEVRK